MTALDRTWTDALLGRVVLERYRLESVLGSGGMGAVFVATHQHMARRVAVKTMRPELAPSHDLAERFVREARAAASAGVKGVVPVTDFGHEPGIGPVLVMELLAGEVLHARIARLGRLAPADALGIARSLCETLGVVHAQGIVHRDLKPANVLLVPQPDRSELPTILDFGLARVATAMRATALTIPGTVLGTPRYMPPEQLGGVEVDARADLYAVGAILYHALSGRPPYADVPRERVYEALAKGPPAALESLVARLAPEACALVARAMARDRQTRFASAEAMRGAIDAVLGAPARAVVAPDTIARSGQLAPRQAEGAAARPPRTRALLVHDARAPGPDGRALAGAPRPRSLARPLVAWIAAAVAALVVGVACVVVAVFVLRDVRPAGVSSRPVGTRPLPRGVLSPFAPTASPGGAASAQRVEIAPRPTASVEDVVRRLTTATRVAGSHDATAYELGETTDDLRVALRDAEALGAGSDPALARALGAAYYADASLRLLRYLGPVRLRSAADCGAAAVAAAATLRGVSDRLGQARELADPSTRACDLASVAALELRIARSFRTARTSQVADAVECAQAERAAVQAAREHLARAADEPRRARCVGRVEQELRAAERSIDDAEPR